MTDEERREAIAYLESDGEIEPSTPAGRRAASRAAAACDWWLDAAAQLLRLGWTPGDNPTIGQRQAVAVAIAVEALRRHGLEVTVRPSRGAAVGAALAGPVTVRYSIEADGEVP